MSSSQKNSKQSSAKNRATHTAHILKYLDTDLLCYRTISPQGLAELQHEKWQPWLDWFEKKYAQKLETTSGLSALTQSEGARKALEQEANACQTEQAFEALYGAITICGSCVLGLAFTKGELTPEQTLDLIFLEENYKEGVYDAEKYGTDPYIEKKKKEALESLNHAGALMRESATNATASKA